MTKKAEKALRKSIEHWKRMRGNMGCGDRPLSSDCALCREFADKTEYRDTDWGTIEVGCVGCPIAARVGRSGCVDTPYARAHRAWSIARMFRMTYGESNPDTRTSVVEWNRAAEDMIAFLESLLPPSEEPKAPKPE
jgi:hypothetical protein